MPFQLLDIETGQVQTFDTARAKTSALTLNPGKWRDVDRELEQRNRNAEFQDSVPDASFQLINVDSGLIEDYYGPGYSMDADDPVEWAYIPHFYFKYYVFTYATGLASGTAIAEMIAKGDPAALDAYLEMLKGGNSKPPLELLKGAGVDLTKPDAIAAALELFDRTLSELEAILVKE